MPNVRIYRTVYTDRLRVKDSEMPNIRSYRPVYPDHVLERRICESVLQILDMGAAEPEFCKSRDQDSLAGALEREKHMPSYKHRKCNNSIDCCDKSTATMNIYEKSMLQRHRFVKMF